MSCGVGGSCFGGGGGAGAAGGGGEGGATGEGGSAGVAVAVTLETWRLKRSSSGGGGAVDHRELLSQSGTFFLTIFTGNQIRCERNSRVSSKLEFVFSLPSSNTRVVLPTSRVT